ncbi:cbb3-type cytochrome c oxidase subunit 3 [uncultured Litoreibacter sp.]|uniref:cbb3-type cytochrome c oxidase subunit 3 n=1 Tax=uncultured Litoreibacter sp. TaxID=1392394 RepID=UPI00260DD290|nr:cbb3-type cytochrome c oxidase subunit 3 [uncultured Litoreibacter sp.]
METYSFLRELADSWVLLAMFGFFLAVIVWAFRPGSTETYATVSQIPLRNDEPMKANKSKCANCTGCTSSKGALDV